MIFHKPFGPLIWRTCPFAHLTLGELQFIYMARQQVFVVEQACIYRDADGYDERAWHVAAWRASERMPVAYARLIEPGAKYSEASMGRVLTTAAGRGIGLGRELVRRVIDLADQVFPNEGLRISAQSRLEHFYTEAGFAVVGEPYLEDGIMHTEMLLQSATPTA
ncbi:GNAT family N-acetyltransferase [Piscinibacter sp. XHJ-5]|uniref:GNAT family N-acetyltransferase n=1 Tax=Piscinibacter sp. XHJ-5 TaxID=3037797 RepID=UPI002452D0BD|nr:GNAT family N-acetyltransferase [Piscinibacter sp. XHJ-5]